MSRSFVSTDKIAAPDSSSLDFSGNNITACGWIFLTGGSGVWNHVVLKQGAATWVAPYAVWALRVNSTSKVEAWVNDGGVGGNYAAGATSISANVWHHVAMTYNGTTLLVYLDGVQDGTKSISAALSSSTFPLSIGNVQGTDNEFFHGNIAEVGVYSATLTSAELAALAKGRLPREIRPASLVGYWPLWGLQSPEPDLSGNANNGTLTGTAQANHAPVTLFTRKNRSSVEPSSVSSVVFRKTLSSLGTRVGSRQAQTSYGGM